MEKSPNKGLVQTAPALCRFDIRARHTGLGGRSGCFLPHTARGRLHNPGVRPLIVIDLIESSSNSQTEVINGSIYLT